MGIALLGLFQALAQWGHLRYCRVARGLRAMSLTCGTSVGEGQEEDSLKNTFSALVAFF